MSEWNETKIISEDELRHLYHVLYARILLAFAVGVGVGHLLTISKILG